MARLVFRHKAIVDLNNIWFYTFEKWSENQADKYYKALEIACLLISRNPKIGKDYKDINDSLLGFKTGKHIIFYQVVNEQEIEIIRILHELMDLKSKFNK